MEEGGPSNGPVKVIGFFCAVCIGTAHNRSNAPPPIRAPPPGVDGPTRARVGLRGPRRRPGPRPSRPSCAALAWAERPRLGGAGRAPGARGEREGGFRGTLGQGRPLGSPLGRYPL